MTNIEALEELLDALIGGTSKDTGPSLVSNSSGKWAPTATWIAKPPDPCIFDYARQTFKPHYRFVPGLANAIKAHSRAPDPTARMGR